MNELTERILSKLQPRVALIVYEQKHDNKGEYFLELRPINDKGCMQEAIPVTYEFMNEISESFSVQGTTPCGVIPPNLLYANTRKGHERYVWYNTPGKRMMYFRKDLGIENGQYYIPGVIYVAEHDYLKIYVFKEERPEQDTELYAAPFFNVSHANVCLGNAKLEWPKQLSFEALLEYWEKKFWLTEFSHLGNNGNPTRSNLVLVTKAAREKPFDLEELKTMEIKLKSLLR